MNPAKLNAIMEAHGLDNADVAAITGKTTRQVHSWRTGIFSVPRTLSLVLYALDEGKISAADIAKWVRRDAASSARKASAA